MKEFPVCLRWLVLGADTNTDRCGGNSPALSLSQVIRGAAHCAYESFTFTTPEAQVLNILTQAANSNGLIE